MRHWLRRPRASARFGATAILTVVVGVGRAQDTGGVHLRDYEPRLRFSYEDRDETRSSPFRTIATHERSVREDLLLRLRGDVYHPRFLDFDLRTELGLEQARVNTTGDLGERSIDGANFAYDLRTHWFKEHPYNGTLYALRREARTRQTLFRTTEAIVSEYGAAVAARDWWIPSRLELRNHDYAGHGADTNNETRKSAALEGLRQVDGSIYEYALRYNDVDLRSGSRTFTDAEAFGSGSWQLGDNPADRLFATTRYRQQRGDLDTSTSQASVAANLQWSESLSSTHQIEFLGSDSGAAGGRNDTMRIDSTLTHRLYESLRTELGAEAQRNDFTGGNVDRYGGHLDGRYQKRLPFGRLDLGYRVDQYLQDESNALQPIAVLDEAHVIDLATPTTLANFGADPASVVVTDATGLVLYVEGVDYRLRTIQGRTQLELALGSAILPGQTVLIDYVFLPRPPIRFKSTGQGMRAGLRIGEWLGFELGMIERNQDLLAGTDIGSLANERSRTAAVDLGTNRASVRAEYEDRDSTFSALERTEYSASLQLPSPDPFAWFANASTFRTRFKDDDRIERGVTASTSLDGSIGDATQTGLRAEYRRLDLRTDEGDGYLLEATLGHRFRKTTLDCRLSYGEEHFLVASDQRHLDLWVSITRTF